MRDIYKTVKKMQTASVPDRVKAMVAQPRGVPQARKIARQTTGYARGGVQKAFLGKLMTKLGLGKRGVVSSTRQDPLDATGQSYTRMRPEATPEKATDYFKKRMGKKKGGKVDKKWIQKAVNPKHKGYCTPMTKPTCTPARKKLAQLFKRKARTGWKKAHGGLIKGKPKLATRGW